VRAIQGSRQPGFTSGAAERSRWVSWFTWQMGHVNARPRQRLDTGSSSFTLGGVANRSRCQPRLAVERADRQRAFTICEPAFTVFFLAGVNGGFGRLLPPRSQKSVLPFVHSVTAGSRAFVHGVTVRSRLAWPAVHGRAWSGSFRAWCVNAGSLVSWHGAFPFTPCRVGGVASRSRNRADSVAKRSRQK